MEGVQRRADCGCGHASEIHPLGAEQIVDTIKQIDNISRAVIERAKPMFGVGAN